MKGKIEANETHSSQYRANNIVVIETQRSEAANDKKASKFKNKMLQCINYKQNYLEGENSVIINKQTCTKRLN